MLVSPCILHLLHVLTGTLKEFANAVNATTGPAVSFPYHGTFQSARTDWDIENSLFSTLAPPQSCSGKERPRPSTWESFPPSDPSNFVRSRRRKALTPRLELGIWKLRRHKSSAIPPHPPASPCSRCANGSGPFTSCQVVDHQRSDGDFFLNKGCANCYYGDQTGNCTFRSRTRKSTGWKKGLADFNIVRYNNYPQ